MRIADPACGTGGFLLAAYEFLNKPGLDRETQKFINEQAIHGNDIVPNVTRLCAMNLYLHGLGGDQQRANLAHHVQFRQWQRHGELQRGG